MLKDIWTNYLRLPKIHSRPGTGLISQEANALMSLIQIEFPLPKQKLQSEAAGVRQMPRELIRAAGLTEF